MLQPIIFQPAMAVSATPDDEKYFHGKSCILHVRRIGDLKSKNLAVGRVSLIGSTLARGDHCITLNYVARRKCNEIRGAFHISNFPWIPFHFIQATLADQTLVHSLCVELDREEAEAIACASELNAELLLVDEERGRAIAQRLGLRVIGLLGVLIEAKHRGLIDAVNPILDALVNRAGFWVTRIFMYECYRRLGKIPLLQLTAHR